MNAGGWGVREWVGIVFFVHASDWGSGSWTGGWNEDAGRWDEIYIQGVQKKLCLVCVAAVEEL